MKIIITESDGSTVASSHEVTPNVAKCLLWALDKDACLNNEESKWVEFTAMHDNSPGSTYDIAEDIVSDIVERIEAVVRNARP